MTRQTIRLNRPDSRIGLGEAELSSLRSALSETHEVAFGYLFGSVIRGRTFRDVDIALYLNPCPSSPYERFKLAMSIGRRLEVSLSPRREVDVRVLNEAPVLFRYEVLRAGRLLFERDRKARVWYEALVISSYLDYQPIWMRLARRGRAEEADMELQPEPITRLEEMAESLADWERYRARVTLAQLRSDRDTRNMVLHAMLVSIQAAIDLANILIAQGNLRTPSTYRDSFEILAEASLIPAPLSEELADLAGFRNVLVHLYWRLDIERAYALLQHGLDPLRQFHELLRKRLLG